MLVYLIKGFCISRWKNKVSATRCFAVRGNRQNHSRVCITAALIWSRGFQIDSDLRSESWDAQIWELRSQIWELRSQIWDSDL